MATKLVEIQERIAARAKDLHDIFEAHPDMDFGDGGVERIRALKAELDDLGTQRDTLQELSDIGDMGRKVYDENHKPVNGFRQPGGNSEGKGKDGEPEYGSPGEWFVNSVSYKHYDRMRRVGPTVELPVVGPNGVKTTFDETTSWTIRPSRIVTPFGAAVPGALQQPTVADLIPQATTDTNAIIYMEETTTTNAAAMVAEGGQKPESALAFTERTAPVRKVATVLPITDELMADAPAMTGYLNARLGLFLNIAEETELLTGANNTSPDFAGLLHATNLQTQAKGADATPDAIYKAIVKIQTTAFVEPSGIVMHPLDWQDIALLTDSTGRYIWGSPAEVVTRRIWGLPVVATTAETQNTALVGAFNTCCQIFRRQSAQFAVSDQHSDFFIKNLLMLRVEERLALAIYRGAAFCTVTGI